MECRAFPEHLITTATGNQLEDLHPWRHEQDAEIDEMQVPLDENRILQLPGIPLDDYGSEKPKAAFPRSKNGNKGAPNQVRADKLLTR